MGNRRSIEGFQIELENEYFVNSHGHKWLARPRFYQSRRLGPYVEFKPTWDPSRPVFRFEYTESDNKARLTGRFVGSFQDRDPNVTIRRLSIFEKWKVEIGKKLLLIK